MFVETQGSMMVRMKRGAAERIEKCQREGLCVACLKPLEKGRVIRGCHESCRRLTQIRIDRGDWTQEQRIAEGKLLPLRPGRRPSNPVTLE